MVTTKHPPRDTLTYVLLIVVILQGFLNLYLLMGNSLSLPANITVDPIGVKRAILDVEYDKVGGKTNYDLINQATQIQTKQQIPQIEQFIKSQGGAVGNTGTTAGSQTPTTELDATRIAALLSGAVIEGNKNADIIAIEYSDMECPFCVRQYHETKLQESLQTQYGDAVAFVFKNNRGVNHQGTEAKALGALCAQKLGGDTAYAKFYHTVMDGTSQSAVYPVAKLADAAKTAGVDVAAWQKCVDTKETLAQFEAQTTEAQGFNLGGTPGTLILNVKTGKYATIEGAYPFTSFTQKIDSLK